MKELYKKNDNGSVVCKPQGDLLFVALTKKPDGECKTIKSGILVHGTSRGHVHRVTTPGATVERYKDGLVISHDSAVIVDHTDKGGAKLSPIEHTPVILSPGVWAVVRQREETPAGLRVVED